MVPMAPAAPNAGTSPGVPRGTAGGPPPYTDSQVRALPGIGVTIWSAGGQRQVASDSNGVVSLGRLSQGRHELSVNTRTLGTGTGNQPAVLALLLPAVQSVREGGRRYDTVVVTPVNDQPTLRIKVDVDAKGQVSSVDWGNGLGVRVAVGDVTGDGRADLKVFGDLAQRNTSGETKLVFVAPKADIVTGAGPGGGPNVRTGTDAGFADGHAKLPNIGVTTTGPGGVMQVRSDGEGRFRLGKLPIGNTIVEFNGGDMASALRTTVGPNTPLPQKTLVELMVVVAIVAIKIDGTPVVFTAAVPANAVKTLKANLRVGRDGNLMDVDWGNGPQGPQSLPKSGAAMLTVPGPNGPIPLNPGLVKDLQDGANKGAPGEVQGSCLQPGLGYKF